jgi:hypothetical protein
MFKIDAGVPVLTRLGSVFTHAIEPLAQNGLQSCRVLSVAPLYLRVTIHADASKLRVVCRQIAD